jgi:hypothetical protein
MLINSLDKTILSLLSSTPLGVDIAIRWLQPILNLPRNITLMDLWSRLPNLMPLFIRNSPDNIESRDSQLSNYSLEVIQLIIRERELLMPCLNSLKRNPISRSNTLKPRLMFRISLLRDFLFFSLFQKRIKKTKRFSLLSVPIMNLLTVLSLHLSLLLLWISLLIWELSCIDHLMMVSKESISTEVSILMLLSLSLRPIDIQLFVSLIKRLPIESSENRERLCSSLMTISNLITQELSKSLPKKTIAMPMVSFSVYLKLLKDSVKDFPNTLVLRLVQLLDISNSITVVLISSLLTTFPKLA